MRTRPRVSFLIALALDVLNGVPAIVVGIFVFALIVLHHGQSALAGSFALSILMIPLIARATQEVLALVPQASREGSLALSLGRPFQQLQHSGRDRPGPCLRRLCLELAGSQL